MSVAPIALGIAAAVIVVRVGSMASPPPIRRLAGAAAPRTSAGPLARVGRPIRRLDRSTRPDDRADRRVGALVLLVLLVLPLLPPGAAALGGGAWVRTRMRRVRRQREHARAVADGLPEAVDLLLLCCGAGIALPLAHPLVAAHLPAPIGPALHAADTATEAGRPRADGLVHELGQLGDRATALAHVLADHLRYGVPLAPALERLGLELRLDRRRRAEQDARKVPIRLLGPLVACVLPAFGLLTVVPLLVASLQTLPT